MATTVSNLAHQNTSPTRATILSWYSSFSPPHIDGKPTLSKLFSRSVKQDHLSVSSTSVTHQQLYQVAFARVEWTKQNQTEATMALATYWNTANSFEYTLERHTLAKTGAVRNSDGKRLVSNRALLISRFWHPTNGLLWKLIKKENTREKTGKRGTWSEVSGMTLNYATYVSQNIFKTTLNFINGYLQKNPVLYRISVTTLN